MNSPSWLKHAVSRVSYLVYSAPAEKRVETELLKTPNPGRKIAPRDRESARLAVPDRLLEIVRSYVVNGAGPGTATYLAAK